VESLASSDLHRPELRSAGSIIHSVGSVIPATDASKSRVVFTDFSLTSRGSPPCNLLVLALNSSVVENHG